MARAVKRLPGVSKVQSGVLRHLDVERQRGPLVMADETSVRLAEMAVADLPISRDRDDQSQSVRLGGPSVAIVVPTFRDSHYLRECLESVRQQSYTDFTCYVVDDASPENVSVVVEEFSRKDDRFVLCRHGRNAGLSAARNTGLVIAQEALVQFLDADDMLTPWAIEARVASLAAHGDRPEVVGTYGEVVQCPDETTARDVAGWKRRSGGTVVDWISSKGESPFNVNSPLLRADAIRYVGGFDETLLNGAEDWDLWQRVLRHGFVFEPTHSIVGAYRQRSASMIREHVGVHANQADALLDRALNWVDGDPFPGVEPAFMPLPTAEDSFRRAIRAARYAGITTATTRDPAGAVTPELLQFARCETLPRSRRSDVITAARGGIVRGLGLGPDSARQLSSDAQARLTRAGEIIANAFIDPTPLAAPPAGAHQLLERAAVGVALIGESLADINPLLTAARRDAEADSIVAIDLSTMNGSQGTIEGWHSAAVRVWSPNDLLLGRLQPDAIVVSGPVGPAARHLVEFANRSGTSVTELDSDKGRLIVEHERDDQRFGAEIDHFSRLLPLEEGSVSSEEFNKLSSLRDRHRGDTVVIIGNGPSLNDTDLSLLKGHVTIGVNSIFLAADRLPDPLTYYVVEDQAVFRENTEAIKSYVAGTKIFPSNYRDAFSDQEIDEKTVFFRMNAGFYGRGTGTYCHPRFSTDVAQRVFCGQSVTIANLQLAYWMGAHRVVLIGMDFSYSIPSDAERRGDVIVSKSEDPNHFDPTYFGVGKTWHDPKLDRVLVNYRLADEVYRADGREIINSTLGGKLEVFPRMPLEEALR
ncbi:glycosyltransferase [Ilumatobacter sp.]|nr:glycosyltransferase [Ilumatobacter sp.]